MPPFLRLSFKRKTIEIILDQREFKPCKAKVVPKWSWRTLRTEKFLVHMDKDGKFIIKKIG